MDIFKNHKILFKRAQVTVQSNPIYRPVRVRNLDSKEVMPDDGTYMIKY